MSHEALCTKCTEVLYKNNNIIIIIYNIIVTIILLLFKLKTLTMQ